LPYCSTGTPVGDTLYRLYPALAVTFGVQNYTLYEWSGAVDGGVDQVLESVNRLSLLADKDGGVVGSDIRSYIISSVVDVHPPAEAHSMH
ncbi:hypothetical protein OFC21_31095, partial [Escherichia coli]|nr:hypothetical protein [Escherichia coli]